MFRRSKKNPSTTPSKIPKSKASEAKSSKVPSQKILTAEGWRRMMLQKTSKK